MEESDFWVRLEFRLCRELAGMPERRLQYFWCDGFIPNEYVFDGSSPRIIGCCWICNGAHQAPWDFALLLPRSIRSRKQIEWQSLLPPDKVTRWMSFDENRRYIEIEPSVAVPDLQ